MSGSIIETDSFAIKFKYAYVTILNDKSFNFFVRQQMLDQLVRFGNSGNNYKVTGSYTAECQLSVNAFTCKQLLKGSYSTTETIPPHFIATGTAVAFWNYILVPRKTM